MAFRTTFCRSWDSWHARGRRGKGRFAPRVFCRVLRVVASPGTQELLDRGQSVLQRLKLCRTTVTSSASANSGDTDRQHAPPFLGPDTPRTDVGTSPAKAVLAWHWRRSADALRGIGMQVLGLPCRSHLSFRRRHSVAAFSQYNTSGRGLRQTHTHSPSQLRCALCFLRFAGRADGSSRTSASRSLGGMTIPGVEYCSTVCTRAVR
jgi:hypothetical protein